MPNFPIKKTSPPTAMFQNRNFAACAPRCPALWISEAATDSGNGSSGSSTMPRRTSEINKTPSTLPTRINADVFQYASRNPNEDQACEIRNAGIVKIAPAATPSPMEPLVRAMFSSSNDPFQVRSMAMPMTAAGYVAATVIPARKPRYALAAPSTIVIVSPSSTARSVNSRICMCSGTNG